MSGSKTRPGFSGGDEPPPSDPEADASPRPARTMIGHEIHLRAPSDPGPAAGVPPIPREEVLARVPPTPREEARASVPEAVTDETTEELPLRPSHTGKTRFPALARLFGRWTTGGGFLSRSRMSGTDDEPLNVPREAWASRVAIFAVAGLVSFLVALAVLKVHHCRTSAPGPSAAGQVSVPPAPPAPAADRAAPAVLPVPSVPAGPPAAASQPSAATAPVVPIAQPVAVFPKTTRRLAKRASGSSARAAPDASGRLRTPSTRPDPLVPPAGATNKDGLLPLGM
jgi:hypothetical protein